MVPVVDMWTRKRYHDVARRDVVTDTKRDRESMELGTCLHCLDVDGGISFIVVVHACVSVLGSVKRT